MDKLPRVEELARYREPWDAPFRARLQPLLRPGMSILDLGPGPRPTLLPGDRPPGCRYVALDRSARELGRAPAGSYHETVVADLGGPPVDALRDSFDLVLSWQVLEHVRRMDRALENARLALRPGGTFLAQLSGGRSLFALANRALPHGVAVVVLERLLDRPHGSVFPAPYDRCTASGLTELLSSWSSAQVVPRYTGAAYFRFFRPLQAAYLVYEEWLRRGDHRDLATHYVIQAVR